MSLRIFSAGLLFVVASCGKIVRETDETPVACALHGQRAFAPECRSMPIGKGDSWAMTIHHPDGGFRRFLVDAAGAVTSADGAERVEQARTADGIVEIAVGGDRYRLPRR